MDGALRRLLFGSPTTIAGTVYGTIIVMAALTAGGPAFEDRPWQLVVIVAATALIFWLSHVYAHGLGESVALGRRLDLMELNAIAQREVSILLAAVLPVSALALGALGIVGHSRAVWLAMGVATATLAAQGVRYARVERLSRGGEALAISVNLGLGLAIVALKVLVAH